MLCERCKKNEAKIHVIKVINGKKSEAMLCEKCARELSDKPLNTMIDNKSKLSFENIISGFFDTLDKGNKIEIVCKKCGLTYGEFKKTGNLGCSDCYESFKDLLKPRIKRIQADIEHIGKVPVREESQVIRIKRIKKLKEDLQKAILAEEYEKAAVIRDEIKLYESTNGGNIDD